MSPLRFANLFLDPVQPGSIHPEFDPGKALQAFRELREQFPDIRIAFRHPDGHEVPYDETLLPGDIASYMSEGSEGLRTSYDMALELLKHTKEEIRRTSFIITVDEEP